jgi:outer membrane immunogenic protein
MADILELDMKQTAASILILVGLGGAAEAADLPAPAPYEAPAAPAFTWTGFYVGGHAGYGWGDFGSEPTDAYGADKPDGFFGGVQAGYNFQFDNRLVLGIDADASFGNLKSGYTAGFSDEDIELSFGHQLELRSFGTVRGRVGYAFDRVLPYATAGLGWARTELDFSNDVTMGGMPVISSAASDKQTLTGWTVGAGLEYAITDNITAKAEYLYTDLGSKDFDLGTPVSADLTLQTVKFGLNYKF